MAKEKKGKLVTDLFSVFTLVILLVLITLLIFNRSLLKEVAQKHSHSEFRTQAQKIARALSTPLEKSIYTTEAISKQISSIKNQDNNYIITRYQVISLLEELIIQNDEFSGIFTIWEKNAFDAEDDYYKDAYGHDHTGRFLPYIFKDTLGETEVEPMQYYNIEGINSFYTLPKTNLKPVILDPYEYSQANKNIFVTSVSYPIMYKNSFYGVVGVNLHIKLFEKILRNEEMGFDDSEITLISNNGTILAHSVHDTISGLKLEDIYDNFNEQLSIVRNGVEYYKTEDYFVEYSLPIYIQNIDNPWQIRIKVPKKSLQSFEIKHYIRLLIISFGIIILSVFVLYTYIKFRIKILEDIENLIGNLSGGELHFKPPSTKFIEFEKIIRSLQTLASSLVEVTTVSESISKGDYTKKIKITSNKNLLAKAINTMSQNLQKAQEEHQRTQKETHIRNWTNQGIADLSDVLRRSSDDLEELSFKIILKLVNHLNASLGGVYIYDESNPTDIHLKLLASFAYDRRKFIETKIFPGEGLIGTCALEKETIYMTNIPDDYITISSGLGESKPNSLIVVPLKLEGELLGVFEIASLYKLEKYQVGFIEKAADSIALTISTVRINQKTSHLLTQSKQQADELVKQEAEMRQNLEELKLVQEEAHKKEVEMSGILYALNSSFLVAEIDMNGFVTKINDSYLDVLKVTKKEAIGSHHTSIAEKINPSEKYSTFWKDLSSGINIHIEQEEILLETGEKIWLMQSYAPIFDVGGKAYKILNIAVDITKTVLSELKQ